MDLFKKKKRALGQAVGGIVGQLTHEDDPEMKAAMRYTEEPKPTPVPSSSKQFTPNTKDENEEDRLRDLQRRRNALQRKSY